MPEQLLHIIMCLYIVLSCTCTVESPSKGHVGDITNSALLSFIERLSSFRGFQCIKTIGKVIFGP